MEGEGVRVREEKVKARKIKGFKLKNHIITTFVLCYVHPHGTCTHTLPSPNIHTAGRHWSGV